MILNLDEKEAQTLIDGLVNLPFKNSYVLIQKIQNEYKKSENEKQPQEQTQEQEQVLVEENNK